MTNRNVVITGANSGIGFETALHFARRGANVVMACRNMDKTQMAQSQILAAVPNARTSIIRLDVADLQSVQAFKRQFEQDIGELDILINNAGIVAIPLTRNEAGHELQLATNYLGAFALTGLLLPFFSKRTPARIVNVGSLNHWLGKPDADDLNWEHTLYHQWKAYANSKVATLGFTLELNRRLQQSGSHIIALAAHPGFARTNIHQNSPALSRSNPVMKWLYKLEALIPTAADAARSIILAADGADVKGGDYYGPGGFLEIGGKPAPARIKPLARDRNFGKRLWTVSESMTGVSYLSGF